MTWIETLPFNDPALMPHVRAAMKDYPRDYATERRHEREMPEAVMRDSIMLAHSLIPRALEHVFAGYAAMLDPELPLSRRQHEMIATVVSRINECFY